MPTHARWADVTLGEAEESEEHIAILGETVLDAIADQRVTPVEARRIVVAFDRARREAREAVVAAECTTIGELLAASCTTVRPFNPTAMERAEKAGMLVIPLEWRRKHQRTRTLDDLPPAA